MSAPFVTRLRAGGVPIHVAEPGAGTLTIRIEVAELWDAFRVVARPDSAVSEVKRRVLERAYPDEYLDDFVLKLRGWEVLDESASLESAGLRDGSILLLAHRRRRPVR